MGPPERFRPIFSSAGEWEAIRNGIVRSKASLRDNEDLLRPRIFHFAAGGVTADVDISCFRIVRAHHQSGLAGNSLGDWKLYWRRTRRNRRSFRLRGDCGRLQGGGLPGRCTRGRSSSSHHGRGGVFRTSVGRHLAGNVPLNDSHRHSGHMVCRGCRTIRYRCSAIRRGGSVIRRGGSIVSNAAPIQHHPCQD